MIESTSLFGPQTASSTSAGPAAASSRRASGGRDTSFSAELLESSEPPPANVAAVERIKEIGFSQWAEELREQKMEEMRAEILASMGLTEEKLAAMDPDARAAIEDAIQQRINERLAAASVEGGANGPGREGAGFAPGPSAQQTAATAFVIGNAPGNGGAIGPATMTVLLNAQETAGADPSLDDSAPRNRAR